MPRICQSKALVLTLSPWRSFFLPGIWHGLAFSVFPHITNTGTNKPFTHLFLLPFVPYNFFFLFFNSIHHNKHAGVLTVLFIYVRYVHLAYVCENQRSMLSLLYHFKVRSLCLAGAHFWLDLMASQFWDHLFSLASVGTTRISKPRLLHGCVNARDLNSSPYVYTENT